MHTKREPRLRAIFCFRSPGAAVHSSSESISAATATLWQQQVPFLAPSLGFIDLLKIISRKNSNLKCLLTWKITIFFHKDKVKRSGSHFL